MRYVRPYKRFLLFREHWKAKWNEDVTHLIDAFVYIHDDTVTPIAHICLDMADRDYHDAWIVHKPHYRCYHCNKQLPAKLLAFFKLQDLDI